MLRCWPTETSCPSPTPLESWHSLSANASMSRRSRIDLALTNVCQFRLHQRREKCVRVRHEQLRWKSPHQSWRHRTNPASSLKMLDSPTKIFEPNTTSFVTRLARISIKSLWDKPSRD